ncbi:MAG: energy-coupling factor transporter transmembrane protein EcfT [Clostridia bacterium]|nr:energy-coupling factor transporter transmembrane protein EcfT [Clostridia bacterium]
MGGFLDFIPGTSIIHRLNPLTKLLAAFVLCASCFISDNGIFVLGIIVLNLLFALIAGKEACHRSLRMLNALLKFSILLFIIQLLCVRSGNVLVNLPLNLCITDEGLQFSTLFVLRLLAATMPLGLMLSVTTMGDLSNVLVEKLHVPYKYAFSLTTAIRFIPLFSQEMAGIMEAQTARGVEFDTKNFFKKIKLLLPLCVPLLLSSVRKIDSAAIAAQLRGFHCRTGKCAYKQYRFCMADGITALIMAGIVVTAFF